MGSSLHSGRLAVAGLAAIAAASVFAAPVADAQQAGSPVSIWSGVYSKAQSARGEEFYSGACGQCHGPRLNGVAQPDQPPSPAIARLSFLRKWSGKPVAELYEYVRTKMPPDNPGSITAQQAIDSIALMLAVSNIPAGSTELPADLQALQRFVIEVEAK